MISLIIATLGRIKEFRILLESLRAQSYKDFELIVVDQNEHNCLENLIEEYKDINIKYIRSEILGLSFNRNMGLKYVHGDIIGFPDDDCYYDENLLMEVANVFKADMEHTDLVSVNAKDVNTGKIFIQGFKKHLSRKDIYYKCISYNFFIRKKGNMLFDEKLGVGAEYGSGEETDFLWEFLESNSSCRLIDSTFVHHPQNSGPVNEDRAYRYGLGFGAIMKKEVMQRRHYWMVSLYLNLILHAVGGILLTRGKLSYYKSLCGRIKGYISYKY